MKTPWKRTLGLILSTGLFIMPLGAYATLGEGQDTTAVSHGINAHHENGQGDSGTELTQNDREAGIHDGAAHAGISLADSTGNLVIAQKDEGAGHDADSQTADSHMEASREDSSKGKFQDKSTQTDVSVEKGGSADKPDKADTTADDEDDNEKVNINTATEEELVEGLKGIGPSKAREIIKYRDKHGDFKKIDHLKKVKGIGPSTYVQIKSQLGL